jgi:hypothetical protein
MCCNIIKCFPEIQIISFAYYWANAEESGVTKHILNTLANAIEGINITMQHPVPILGSYQQPPGRANFPEISDNSGKTDDRFEFL